jgi:tellurite resistance protein
MKSDEEKRQGSKERSEPSISRVARRRGDTFVESMDPKRKLKGMLARIFSDAVAEQTEREELKAYLSTSILTEGEIKDVFEDFVRTTWKITIADGVVSDREKQRLREIVSVLALEKRVLPAEWAAIVED